MENNENSEVVVNTISARLRVMVHDFNNSVFAAKGFLEEISVDVKEKKYTQSAFDHENFVDMLNTVIRNIERIDQSVVQLKKFAKEELFEQVGTPNPDLSPAPEVVEPQA